MFCHETRGLVIITGLEADEQDGAILRLLPDHVTSQLFHYKLRLSAYLPGLIEANSFNLHEYYYSIVLVIIAFNLNKTKQNKIDKTVCFKGKEWQDTSM
jgi:hypothetical protein